jgi:hypothetical protein
MVRTRRLAEANGDREYLRQWEVYLGKWKRRTIALGVALILNVMFVVPFLDGYSLHRYFAQGRYLTYTSCCLLTLFVGACALTYNFWSYTRSLRARRQQDSSRPE